MSRVEYGVYSYIVSLLCYGRHGDLHSFPTRRSSDLDWRRATWMSASCPACNAPIVGTRPIRGAECRAWRTSLTVRSEEHTSELQSSDHLVCRLLLEKKNPRQPTHIGIRSQAPPPRRA